MIRAILIVILLLPAMSFAQEQKEFESLRFNDDFSYLENDSSASLYSRLKYLPLGNHGYHSLGGELRGQFFRVENEDWGETGEPHDLYLLHRYLLHSDVHLSQKLRTFIQLQGSFAFGKDFVSPVDQSGVDVHQAFLEYGTESVVARIGRQEFQYGSQRLISVRELPNSRQSFDALKFVVIKKNKSLDLIYGHYVIAKPKSFDEHLTSDVKLWGSYGVFRDLQISSVDLYYLGLYKRLARFDSLAGRELRHSIGARVWRNGPTWKTDFEGVYQFGKVGSASVNAYTISSNTRYTFSGLKFSPELGLKTEVISGNASYDDNAIETFNPLFPKGAYFGLAALIGPSNLIDVHPSLSLTLKEGLVYTIDYDGFWRYSRNDGIYNPSVSLIYSGAGREEKKIGHQFSTNVDWGPSKYLSVRVEVTWFKAGAFLKETGAGKNVLFAGLTTQIKF